MSLYETMNATSLEARIAKTARLIEDRLTALLEREGADLTRKETHGWRAGRPPKRLMDATRHAVLGGGKRFRPFLLLETAALFDAADENALPAALAVELIHCYSLVHDDLPAMDNDTLRRGQPTVWHQYDEWTAILVGDGLNALAFQLLAECSIDAAIRAQLVSLLARASGVSGMVGGQARDLDAERTGTAEETVRAADSVATVRELQAMKTGALIRFCCEAGAAIGGAEPDARAALCAYGEHLGYAFQIADDLLDATGDAATLGKAVAKDADAGKATLVSLMGEEKARAELSATRDAAIDVLAPFGTRADTLKAAADFVVNRRR